MGLITNPALGAGFVNWDVLTRVLGTLRRRYSRFGGVMGWEYFCAMPGEQEEPWQWAERCRDALEATVVDEEVGTGVGGEGAQGGVVRPFGALVPAPAHPFAAESVESLKVLGFGQQQAVAALNMTSGNVEQAAALLFAD